MWLFSFSKESQRHKKLLLKSMKDVRWLQRFSNFRKALKKLGEVVTYSTQNELSELEQEGLIQRFEYTYELAWKTLQDLFKEKGYEDAIGPNPVLKRAFSDGFITDGEGWQKMKESRQLSSHTYNPDTAEEIARLVVDTYYPLFRELEEKLNKESQQDQTSLF